MSSNCRLRRLFSDRRFSASDSLAADFYFSLTYFSYNLRYALFKNLAYASSSSVLAFCLCRASESCWRIGSGSCYQRTGTGDWGLGLALASSMISITISTLLSSSSRSWRMGSWGRSGNFVLSLSVFFSSRRTYCWQYERDPDNGVFILRVSCTVKLSVGSRYERSTCVDIFGESLLNDYTSQSPPQPFIIIMKQKTFNEMTKEEMKEREREMKKRLMKETRELDREIYKVESMKKQAEDKLKKEVAKGPKADNFSKKTYARQVLQCQKNIERYSVNKAKIKNLQYQIDSFMANAKMAQMMGATGSLMAQVNKKINIQGTQLAMNKAQEEFMKMGLMQEMIDDALTNNDVDDVDIDEEAEKLLRDMEINAIKNTEKKKMEEMPMPGIEQPNELDDFEKRLNALK